MVDPHLLRRGEPPPVVPSRSQSPLDVLADRDVLSLHAIAESQVVENALAVYAGGIMVVKENAASASAIGEDRIGLEASR